MGLRVVSDALPVWIGYDAREHDAALVCEHSLRSRSSAPLHIQRLHEPSLRHIGLYDRPWRMDGGQRYDERDGKPFSTSFSFSRWLVPSLMQHRGLALFVDCDFLFLDDVAKLFERFDPRFAVQVVKHWMPEAAGLKMDGQIQQPYYRKNWSSLCLWNAGHPSNQRLTPSVVSNMSGQWLHGFSWLDDHEIGELPADWNWLAGIDAPTGRDPSAVHFTLGAPDMPGHENDPYAFMWREELALAKANREPPYSERAAHGISRPQTRAL